MAGFTVNAAEATRLANEMRARRARLVPMLTAATVAAGRQILALSREGAPRGPYTRKFGSQFGMRVKQRMDGCEVTIENRNPLGAVIVFGTSTSGPHDSPGEALAAVDPSFTAAVLAAAAEGL